MHRIEYRNTVYFRTSLARRSAANDIRSIFFHLLGMDAAAALWLAELEQIPLKG